LRKSLLRWRSSAQATGSNADMAEVDTILARHGTVTVPPGWLED
jgi:hypothetical protein